MKRSFLDQALLVDQGPGAIRFAAPELAEVHDRGMIPLEVPREMRL